MKRCSALGMWPIALENKTKSECFNKLICIKDFLRSKKYLFVTFMQQTGLTIWTIGQQQGGHMKITHLIIVLKLQLHWQAMLLSGATTNPTTSTRPKTASTCSSIELTNWLSWPIETAKIPLYSLARFENKRNSTFKCAQSKF